MLLPALARAKFRARSLNCMSNFKQWCVVANVYAGDDVQGRLPRYDWGGGGGQYCWDVSTNMVPGLAPYGLVVQMWFDPVRPDEFDAAEKTLGRSIATIQDLEASFQDNPYAEAIINHNWWVQRSESLPALSSTIYPPDITTCSPLTAAQFLATHTYLQGTPLGQYGTAKMSGMTASWNNTPFVSCKAASSMAQKVGFVAPTSGKASTSPNDMCPNTAHFFNGALQGVNAAYADGHVEFHNKLQIVCGYVQGSGPNYWFY
jgi:prepilin-type processing-associated H-X9-DG protein